LAPSTSAEDRVKRGKSDEISISVPGNQALFDNIAKRVDVKGASELAMLNVR
jgi:hypothetical protein